MRIVSFLIGAVFFGAAPAMTAPVSAEKLSPDRHRAAHDMLERLVNIPTVFGRGNVPTLANYLAEQYRAAGFPAEDVPPLRPDVTAAFSKAVHTLHPGAPVSPEMSTGASDARPFRVAGSPIYGANGAWVVVPVDFRAHGKDERLPVKALDDNVAHWKILLAELAGK
jgi:acetylornithine deacetylase/succinyl-diaminopimelate desuccinylase-like protein